MEYEMIKKNLDYVDTKLLEVVGKLKRVEDIFYTIQEDEFQDILFGIKNGKMELINTYHKLQKHKTKKSK